MAEPSILGALRDPQFRSDTLRNLVEALNGAKRSLTVGSLGAVGDMGNTLANLVRAGAGTAYHEVTGRPIPQALEYRDPARDFGTSASLGNFAERQGWLPPQTFSVPEQAGALLGPIVAMKAPDLAQSTLRGLVSALKSEPSRRMVEGYMNGMGMKPQALPQDAALATAHRNGVDMLGLPENHTPMDRARALGFDADAVHFSRHGIDATELDSGKYAVAPFDAIGTHVGTIESARDRFRNTVGTTDQVKGSSYPVLIRRGDEFISPNGGAWNEDALNAALIERGGYENARETYQSLNAKLRKDLFKGSGYDSIPYVNDVEGKGSVSHIVPPWNIRSRFAAFDPARRNESDLLANFAGTGILSPLVLERLAELREKKDMKRK